MMQFMERRLQDVDLEVSNERMRSVNWKGNLEHDDPSFINPKWERAAKIVHVIKDPNRQAFH